MANRYVDGFEWLPTSIGSNLNDTDMTEAGWYINRVNGQSFYCDIGRFGYGKCIAVNISQINGFSTRYIKTLPDFSRPTEGWQGFALMRPSGGSTQGWHGFCFYDAVQDAPQVTIAFGRNGLIKAFRGMPDQDFNSSTGFLGSSVAGAFDEDVWFHCEAHATIAGSGAVIEVRINTVPMLQITGLNTQNTSNAWYDSVALIAAAPVAQVAKGKWDDMFVNDQTGALHNTWLGNQRVRTQFMVGNGFTNQFTIGGSSPAATNWQSVLNQNLDDTKFVYSATAGQIDLYTPDPQINAPTVHVVQLRSGLRQDDATQRQASHLIRVSGTNYINSTIHYPNQNYSHYYSRWELNPATSVEFTGTDVNGFQVGIKLVA